MNTTNYCIKLLTPEATVQIYRDIAPAHFPADELKPVAAIEALYDLNAYLGLGLYRSEDDMLMGYALFLTPPASDTVLLDYYAVLEEYRELGLGSFFLQEMKRYFQETSDIKWILIETEDPACTEDKEEALLRNRRNAFYYKNGAHPTGVACTLFGVPFQIQFLPTVHAETEQLPQQFFRERMETTYQFMLPPHIYKEHVQWR